MFDSKFMMSCICGCGSALCANELDGIIYLDFLSSDFYTNQNIINFPLKLLFNKNRYIKDIVLTENELVKFRDYLKSVKSSQENTKNYSRIIIQPDESGLFFLFVKSNLTTKEILSGKYHRAYEIALNKRDKYRLIAQINRALNIKKCIQK